MRDQRGDAGRITEVDDELLEVAGILLLDPFAVDREPFRAWVGSGEERLYDDAEFVPGAHAVADGVEVLAGKSDDLVGDGADAGFQRPEKTPNVGLRRGPLAEAFHDLPGERLIAIDQVRAPGGAHLPQDILRAQGRVAGP